MKTAITILLPKTVVAFLKEIYQIVNGTISDSTLPNAEAMYYQLKMRSAKTRFLPRCRMAYTQPIKPVKLDTVENDAAIIFDTARVLIWSSASCLRI